MKRHDCGQEIRTRMDTLGCEVTVSTIRPLVSNPYLEAMECPHGVTYYFEPTGDQIAVWARDGVR